MASLVLSGDTSGSITLAAPAVAGSTTQTLVATSGTLAPLVSGTAVSASGTSVDFTGIPSWVKRITVMFVGVSTNGSSLLQVRGGAGSFETSGYLGAIGTQTFGAGFFPYEIGIASLVLSGQAVLTLVSGNTWAWTSTLAQTTAAGSGSGAGHKVFSGTLDRVRITTVNGTDTFDAGTINILYE